jgi:hypothetical protein
MRPSASIAYQSRSAPICSPWVNRVAITAAEIDCPRETDSRRRGAQRLPRTRRQGSLNPSVARVGHRASYASSTPTASRNPVPALDFLKKPSARAASRPAPARSRLRMHPYNVRARGAGGLADAEWCKTTPGASHTTRNTSSSRLRIKCETRSRTAGNGACSDASITPVIVTSS